MPRREGCSQPALPRLLQGPGCLLPRNTIWRLMASPPPGAPEGFGTVASSCSASQGAAEPAVKGAGWARAGSVWGSPELGSPGSVWGDPLEPQSCFAALPGWAETHLGAAPRGDGGAFLRHGVRKSQGVCGAATSPKTNLHLQVLFAPRSCCKWPIKAPGFTFLTALGSSSGASMERKSFGIESGKGKSATGSTSHSVTVLAALQTQPSRDPPACTWGKRRTRCRHPESFAAGTCTVNPGL